MRTIDMIALLLSAIVAITMALITIRKSVFALRVVPAFFMFFGPAAILVHMGCHVGEISYNAVQNIAKDTFVYDFRFYSLMLMAGVLIFCCVVLLKRINQFLTGGTYINVLKTMALIFIASAPTVPFTPIGSLPTMACIITLVAMSFVKKVKKVVQHEVVEEWGIKSSYQ